MLGGWRGGRLGRYQTRGVSVGSSRCGSDKRLRLRIGGNLRLRGIFCKILLQNRCGEERWLER